MKTDIISKIYFLILLEITTSISNFTVTTSNSTVTTNTVSKTTTEKISVPLLITQLKVDIGKNKTIYLPNNSVSLIANVYDNTSARYEYEWELLSKPENKNAGTLEGKNNKELILKNLILGEYQFKVTVKGNNSYGEALVFVIVKPEKRKDEPPIAIIKPPSQTVQLPNNIILDGSGSTDDDKIVSYHWENIKGPIEMEKNLKDDQPMLQLDKNIIAGNYTFKLTVKDSSGQSNFTTAYLEVLPEKDYPPKSDPGPNIILNLPINSVILNGTGSTDDKKIVSYEWSKISDSLTADIQGVRKPVLRLTNLQEGTYTFNLKVIDSAGQISNKEVKVFVKPRVNIPPVAKASKTSDGIVKVQLPATIAFLDGSLSSDDEKIVRYKWKQIMGKPNLTLVDGDKAIASVTDLKVGTFRFNLTVWDAENQFTSDSVTLIVNEDRNLKPQATIAENSFKFYYLQPNLVKIDGSKSWDDHKIEKYQWLREEDSLAVGDVLEKSDTKSVLLLSGLLPGTYKFKLTVYDKEGLQSSASTQFDVLPSMSEKYLIELQFRCAPNLFTESKKILFIKTLQLLLQKKVISDISSVTIHVLKTDSIPFTESMSILFYVTLHEKSTSSYSTVTKKRSVGRKFNSKIQNNSKINNKSPNMDALHVVEALNEVRHNKVALLYPVIRIDTYVCQNDCSGHGTCNSVTRLCECDTFWTNSFLRDRFGDGRPNCDWSIIYLVLFYIFAFSMFLGFIYVIIVLRRKKCKNKKLIKSRKAKYMRLNEYDPKIKVDPSLKFPKSLTNGIKSRSVTDKEMNICDDSDSSLSSDGEETVFINNRNTASSSLLSSTPVVNGQTLKNL